MVIPAAWGLVLLLGLASPALGGDCHLALVLALDVSESINHIEDRFQRQGLAQALVHPEVVRAFLTGGPVALYVFEWSDEDSAVALSPGWQTIESRADLARVAEAIAATEFTRRVFMQPSTALGAALGHAAEVLSEVPECRTRIVDVAGDGENNSGPDPQAIYRSGVLDGVTVNALIVDRGMDNHELVLWFQEVVLHGPGAFWMLADGYKDYQRAMTAKLLRELELPAVAGLLLAGDGA